MYLRVVAIILSMGSHTVHAGSTLDHTCHTQRGGDGWMEYASEAHGGASAQI